jgi:DNA-directed RNA polymerase specialized sigma subunit, sigma24 homolog
MSLQLCSDRLYTALGLDTASIDQKTKIYKAILLLADDQQKILRSHYESEMTVSEIASKLECSVTTVYTKLNTAIFKLKLQFNPTSFDKAFQILYPETGKPVSY